jgi:oligo-1,6-glucosidase
MTVGETPFTHDPETLASYVLPSNKELQMVFQFELCDLDHPPGGHNPLTPRPWTVPELGAIIARWQNFKRDEGYWNA